MKGVLLKDLYIAKSNILVTIVSLIILGFGLSFLVETSALLVLAPVASTTAVFISIASDAGSKWNKNVITMPVSRNQIISEKFVFYILLAIVGLITALIPCIMLMLVGVAITVHSLCLYAAIGMSATLLAGGISLPCAYLFDPEKSQIVFMMSFMASRVSDETFRLVIFFSDWTWFSAMMRHSNQQRAWLRHAIWLGTMHGRC